MPAGRPCPPTPAPRGPRPVTALRPPSPAARRRPGRLRRRALVAHAAADAREGAAARPFADLLSVADVDELVADRALRTPFFRTVREGGGLPTPVRTVTAGNRRIGDLVDGDALRAQHADGATLVLQSVHRLHPPVARFCRELAAELGHATQCNAYITPAGDAQGFDFHHDTHDVFVLQVSGRKRWIVHEPVLRAAAAVAAGGRRPPGAGGRRAAAGRRARGGRLPVPAARLRPRRAHHRRALGAPHGRRALDHLVRRARRRRDARRRRAEPFRDALPVQPAERARRRARLPAARGRLARRAAGRAGPRRCCRAGWRGRCRRSRSALLAAAAALRDAAARPPPLRPRAGPARAARRGRARRACGCPAACVELPASTTDALRCAGRPVHGRRPRGGRPGRRGRAGARPAAAARGRWSSRG